MQFHGKLFACCVLLKNMVGKFVERGVVNKGIRRLFLGEKRLRARHGRHVKADHRADL